MVDLIGDLRSKIKTQDDGLTLLVAEIETLYTLIGTTRSDRIKASITSLHQLEKHLEDSRNNVSVSMNSLTKRHNETVKSDRQATESTTKSEATSHTKMCSAETQSPCWWDAEPLPPTGRKRRDVKQSISTQSAEVKSQQKKDEQVIILQSEEEAPWTEVPARKKKSAPTSGKKKHMRHNPNVIIVESEVSKYSKVMKNIKSGANMNLIGDKITALRQTKAGGVLIQVAGRATAVD